MLRQQVAFSLGSLNKNPNGLSYQTYLVHSLCILGIATDLL